MCPRNVFLSPDAAWELSHGNLCTYESELCIRNKVARTRTAPSDAAWAILDFIWLLIKLFGGDSFPRVLNHSVGKTDKRLREPSVELGMLSRHFT